jgi:hypothetical protein
MTRTIKFSLTLATAAIFAACGSPAVVNLGDGGGGTPTPTANPTGTTPPGATLALAITNPTVATDIGYIATDTSVVQIPFTITPSSGFKGTVTVHVTNVPAGVTIADVQVPISTSSPATGNLVVESPANSTRGFDAVPGTYSTLSVSAVSGATAAPAQPLTLTLNPNFHVQTMSYPAGTQTANDFWGPDPTVAGSKGLVVHIGNAKSVMVYWMNNDGVNPHEIHRGGGQAVDPTGMSNPATFLPSSTEASDVPSGGTSASVLVDNGSGDVHLNGTFGHGIASANPGTVGDNYRTFTPVDPTAVTVMDFHCHVHNAMSGRVTIMP